MKAKTAGKFVFGILAWAIAINIVTSFTNTEINLFLFVATGFAGAWIWNFFKENIG